MSNNNGKIISLPDAENVRMEAASWITVLGRDQLTSEDAAKFKEWLGQSDRHKEAFQSLSVLCGELSILKELDDVATATIEAMPPEANYLPRRAIFAAAASIAAVMVVGGAYQFFQQRSLLQDAVFATVVGEQQTIELVDGSSVQINTDTKVYVDFSRGERRIQLARGEAYFDVVKDSKRPFSVVVGDRVITAVGTAFSVRKRKNDAVEVTVEEGRVALAALATAEGRSDIMQTVLRPPIAQLSAGQSTVFRETVEDIKQMPAPELQRKLAWRQGMLAYSGEPLADVIEDISRYTDIRIEVADQALLDRQVAGYFRAEEVDASISSLALSFGLRLEYLGANHVRLTEGPS